MLIIFIMFLLLVGIFLLIYGLIKTRSIYKILFLMENQNSTRQDIKRIYEEIIKTTDLKEKNKLRGELKKNLKLFQIKDTAVEGLVDNFSEHNKYKVDEKLLSQFNVAIGIVIIGFIVLLIVIFSTLTMIRLSPYYHSYFSQI